MFDRTDESSTPNQTHSRSDRPNTARAGQRGRQEVDTNGFGEPPSGRPETQIIENLTELRIDDRINVRSIETDKEDSFIVVGFVFEVVDKHPQVSARLRTPDGDPAPIVVFDTPEGIVLSPTASPHADPIDAEIILFEWPNEESRSSKPSSDDGFKF